VLQILGIGSVPVYSTNELSYSVRIISPARKLSYDIESLPLQFFYQWFVKIVDMSTIAYKVTKEIAASAEARGVEMVDAPVSGEEQGAIDGALSIMVGGKREVFEHCLDIFYAMEAVQKPDLFDDLKFSF
jgi:hypothetical protein